MQRTSLLTVLEHQVALLDDNDADDGVKAKMPQLGIRRTPDSRERGDWSAILDFVLLDFVLSNRL